MTAAGGVAGAFKERKSIAWTWSFATRTFRGCVCDDIDPSVTAERVDQSFLDWLAQLAPR